MYCVGNPILAVVMIPMDGECDVCESGLRSRLDFTQLRIRLARKADPDQNVEKIKLIRIRPSRKKTQNQDSTSEKKKPDPDPTFEK